MGEKSPDQPGGIRHRQPVEHLGGGVPVLAAAGTNLLDEIQHLLALLADESFAQKADHPADVPPH